MLSSYQQLPTNPTYFEGYCTCLWRTWNQSTSVISWPTMLACKETPLRNRYFAMYSCIPQSAGFVMRSQFSKMWTPREHINLQLFPVSNLHRTMHNLSKEWLSRGVWIKSSTIADKMSGQRRLVAKSELTTWCQTICEGHERLADDRDHPLLHPLLHLGLPRYHFRWCSSYFPVGDTVVIEQIPFWL